MRVLYLTEIFLPRISGYTVHVNNLASYFSKSNDVLVVTSSDKILPKEEEINSYKVRRLFSLTNPFNVDTKLSYLAVLKINKIIQEFQPDIIHVHDPAFISYFGAKFARQNKIPVIYTQHASSHFPANFMPEMFKDLMSSFYQKFLSKFMNENCNVIISPSKYIKKDLTEIGVNTSIEIVSNGVDFNIFNPSKVEADFVTKYNLWKNNLPTLLCVTRLSKDKNIDTLFLIIKKIIQKNTVNVVIIGDGEKRDLFLDEFSSSPHVRMFAEIKSNSKDLNLFYNYSDIFLIVSAIEAQSLVTMESMSCGLPIVANNSGALPELVHHEENGFLVDGNSVDEVVTKIDLLLSDKNKREKYGKKSLEIIKEHKIEETYKKIYDIYKQVIFSQDKA